MQLHLYVSDETARMIRIRAEAKGVPVSRYLAEVVQREVEGGWPQGYFETVIGGWQGEAPSQREQGELETRTLF